MKPVSPSAQETVTSSPSERTSVASPVPTTAGIPSSRAMIAAWQVRPPRLVTIAEARFMIGSQSGSVMSATRTSPVSKAAIWSIEVRIRTLPAPMRWPMARPSTSTRPVSFRRKRLRLPAVLAGLHGLRARLQDVQAAVDPVLAPFDVHRAAVVVLDGEGVAGELLDVVVREAEAVPQRSLDRNEVNGVADFAVARVGHLERLLAQPALEDGRPARLAAPACRRRTHPG